MLDRPLSGARVLVVEDEYLIALEAQRIIEEAGAAEVLLANSVGDVQKLLADGPDIDVVILDLKLRNEDATPLVEEFNARQTPLLVTTGFESNVPSSYPRLTKPYDGGELIRGILHLLKRE